MTKVLTTALLTLGSAVLLTSCGGGGSTSLPGSSGGSSSSGDKYIKMKSLQIETQNGVESNPVIYPDDMFYIKWKVDYSGSSNYGVAFYATQTDSKPTIDNNTNYFDHTNCIEGLTDCSKGLKCHYYSNSNGYFIECASYSAIPGYEGWSSYGQRKKIEPTNINYISADAYIYVFKLNGNSVETKTIHSTKSVPITFSP